MTLREALCPACHHRDHDPGACEECPRCELHIDEALEWVTRIDPASIAALAEPDSLDAAWAAAEAALPEGWSLDLYRHDGGDYSATAGAVPEPGADYLSLDGPTPAAALTALAQRLTETPR